MLRWSVDEVAVWLESRGLGQYAETFKRSKVNGESLVGLSEAQVRDELQLGGNDLHLRSMMAARNALLGEQKGKLAGASAPRRCTAHALTRSRAHRQSTSGRWRT